MLIGSKYVLAISGRQNENNPKKYEACERPISFLTNFITNLFARDVIDGVQEAHEIRSNETSDT